MNTADILDQAADLIEPEGAWTQGWFARDRHGHKVPTWSPDAVCWCAIGAILRAANLPSVAGAARSHIFSLVGPIPDFNDAPERTQAEVVAKLREAAALARQGGVS